MNDREQRRPSPKSAQPLSYLRVSPAKVLTAPGVLAIAANDRFYAIMWRLVFHTWTAGPSTAQVCALASGCSVDDLRTLESIGVLSRDDSGHLSIPWVESERTEMDAYRSEQLRKSALGVAARGIRSTHGSPTGQPTGNPGEDSRVKNPSGSSSPPSPTAQSEHENASKTKKDPKPNPKKGDHVQIVETFQRAWADYRHHDELEAAGLKLSKDTDPKLIPAAALYVPRTADWVAADKLWRMTNGNMPLIRERMRNLFDSTARWAQQMASPALLHSRWSTLENPVHDFTTNGASYADPALASK